MSILMNRIGFNINLNHMENVMKKHLYLCIGLLCLLSTMAHAQIQTLSIESAIYDKKQIFDISLPESYTTSPTRSYPIIYVLHGQWDMSLVTATLETMSGEIPEFIVVGIHGKGQQLHPITERNKKVGIMFRTFIHNELIPHVNKHYRIANYNILVGHSNSGRFAMEQMLTKNKHYKDYFVFSPSLDDGYLTAKAKDSNDLNGNLFISVANEGEHMGVPFDDILSIFKDHNGLTVNARKYPNYSHQSSKIIALVNALQLRFSNWQPSYNTKKSGYDNLMTHYNNLSQEFGFKVIPDRDDIIKLVAYFAIENKPKEIKKFSRYLIKMYANGDESLNELKHYLSQEGYAKAAETIQLAN